MRAGGHHACSFAATMIAVGVAVLPAHHGPVAISRQVLLMGTRATLTTWDENAERGARRLETLLEPLEGAEARLSTWRDDSEISRLNAAAGLGPQPLSAATCGLFTTLDRWVTATHRAFDPAIGPLAAAWDIHGTGRIPPARMLAAARERSGWHRLWLDAERCRLTLPAGAAIDVGAFGKGEGLDAARRNVADDPAPWMIDLGGQIAAAGAPPGLTGWKISLARPDRRTVPLTTLTMTVGSLSTSGGSERDRHVGGVRVSHHIDPRTGRPARFTGSVSVWHPSALVADALSTALYVMGPREGLAWAEAHAHAVLFAIVGRGGTVSLLASRAFQRQFGTVDLTARDPVTRDHP